MGVVICYNLVFLVTEEGGDGLESIVHRSVRSHFHVNASRAFRVESDRGSLARNFVSQ